MAKLDSDLKLGYEILEVKYPGSWRITDNKLYKGQTLINESYEFVDNIKKQTGSLATIFMNDTRIATNVTKEDGSRAIGTKAAPEVVDIVLGKGREFSGIANVAGEIYRTKYMQLMNL